MQIYKTQKCQLPLKESYSDNANFSYINEALGLFPKQNELVELLTNVCFEMLSMDIQHKEVYFNKIEHLNGVDLSVEILPDFSYNKRTSAEFWGIKNDLFVIKIIISNYDKLSLPPNELKAKISSCLTHELNHGYVMLSKYYNSSIIDETPDFYHNCLKVYNDNTLNNNVKNIAYIFYLSYKTEIQAMIPQIYQELKKFFDIDDNLLTLDNFKKYVGKCEIYWTFYSTLHDDIPQIENYLSNPQNIKQVIDILQENGIMLTVNQLIKKIRNTKIILNAALKDICRCAIAFYYDNVRKNDK